MPDALPPDANPPLFHLRLAGDYPLEAFGYAVGDDFVVSISGGTRPHVGAVAVAQPRPSLSDPKQTSATVSVVTLLGHKEDLLAREVAETLCRKLNRVVVATVGVHWENLNEKGIKAIEKEVRVTLDKILSRILEGV